MTSPMTRAAGRGCAGSLGTLALVVALFVAFGALAPALLERLPDDPAVRLPAALAVLVAFLAAIAAVAFGTRRRQVRPVDDAFAALGLAGSSLLVASRQYHGQAHGRRVDAYLQKGPLLEVYVATGVATRFAVGTRTRVGSALGSLLGLAELALPDPAFATVIASSDDPRWGHALASDPAARDALLRLVLDPSGREMRSVQVQPGAVVLRRHYLDPGALTADELARAVHDLALVASVAERLPAPSRALAATPMQQALHVDRGAATRRIALWTVAGVLLLGLVATAVMVTFLGTEAGDASSSPARRGRHRR